MQHFCANLTQNITLAVCTVPAEGLALRRIFYVFEHYDIRPLTYLDTIKNIGIKGLFSGSISRVNYCLVSNFATLQGFEWFGKDYKGILMTTVSKNIIIPFFLASNARQTGLNFAQTFSYIAKNIKDPVVHGSFMLRNGAANSCLLPGFFVKDYCERTMQETDTQIPVLLGYGTSVFASALMNAFLKPFFTGSYSFSHRWSVACKLPALLTLSIREAASLGVLYGNLP